MFLVVTVTVTVAAVTALFIFWSFVSVQPGTATALAMLFLVAPGLGLASGLLVAFRAVKKPTGKVTPNLSAAYRWLLTGLGALVGGLAGFGGTIAFTDLFYPERWSADPSSAPSWLPVAPAVGGVTMASLVALLVLLSVNSQRTCRDPIQDLED